MLIWLMSPRRRKRKGKVRIKAGHFSQGATWLSPVVRLPLPAPFAAAAAERSPWQGQSRAGSAHTSLRPPLLVAPASRLPSFPLLPSHPSCWALQAPRIKGKEKRVPWASRGCPAAPACRCPLSPCKGRPAAGETVTGHLALHQTEGFVVAGSRRLPGAHPGTRSFPLLRRTGGEKTAEPFWHYRAVFSAAADSP